MTGERRRVSIFLLAIFLLQAVPVARELTGKRETLWPFLAWGMFRHASGPPVETSRWRFYARTRDGEREIDRRDAGFDRYAFRHDFRRPIATGDSAAARALAARVSAGWGVPVLAVVAQESIYSIGPDGLGTRPGTRRVFDARPAGAGP